MSKGQDGHIYLEDVDDVLNQAEEEDVEKDNAELIKELKRENNDKFDANGNFIYDSSSDKEAEEAANEIDLDEEQSDSKHVHFADDAEQTESSDAEHNSAETLSESSISTYEDVEDLKPILEKETDHKEGGKHLGVTQIQGVDAEIVVSNSKTEKMSDEQVQEKMKENAEKFVKQAKNKANEILKNDETYTFVIDQLQPDNDFYKRYSNLLLSPLYISEDNIRTELETKQPISTNSFIRGITDYDQYKTFDIPHEPMLHSIPETMVILKHCNKLFDFEFVHIEGTDFKLDNLDKKILEFMGKHVDKPNTIFDHRFIVSIFGKLEILLTTNIERMLKVPEITIGQDFLKACGPYLTDMMNLQSEQGTLYRSWKMFYESLFGIDPSSKNLIFNIDHYKYSDLNEMLAGSYIYKGKEVARNLGQMEILLANTLKCYSPHLVLCYFFLIRTLYIMARLLSLYIQLNLYKGKNQEEIAKNLSDISALAVLIYEQKYWMWKSSMRAPLKTREGDVELSPEAQQFMDNFIICGGQYYLLKAIETGFPVFSYMLSQSA